MNLLKNGMFFDLGLLTSEYEKEIAISSTIFDLQKKFTLVVIYEYLDESLVLLKRKLCWEMDDIIYLRSLLPRDISSNFTISSEALDAISKWNMADFMLYNVFNASLWEQIHSEKDFYTELANFKTRRRQVENYCKRAKEYEGTISLNFVNLDETQSLGTTVKLRDICSKMAMGDVEYLEYFRKG